jgi:peptidoglycan hydrolase-like protein with peptidoglycan-binding domain
VPSPRNAAAAAVFNERMSDIDRSTVGAFLARIGATLLPIGSLLWRPVSRRPVDSFGLVLGAVAAGAIVVNALFLQVSPHPAPILPGKPRPVAFEATGTSPPGRAGGREASAAETPAHSRTRQQLVSDIQRELARRGFFDGPIDGVYGAKTDAAIRDFEQAAGQKSSSQPDEALLRAIARSPLQSPSIAPMPPTRPIAANRNGGAVKPPSPTPVPPASISPSRRVLAVQRALADFGYGQVKPSGVAGADTKAAIERFERERKLPVTGQVSDRLVRELAAVTGRPLE